MKDDDSANAFVEGMVADPDGDLVFLDKLNEKELLDLLFRLTKKAKAIRRSKHLLRHGNLLDTAKVLHRIYAMNLHRWGIDSGMSREKLEFFEHEYKNA